MPTEISCGMTASLSVASVTMLVEILHGGLNEIHREAACGKEDVAPGRADSKKHCD